MGEGGGGLGKEWAKGRGVGQKDGLAVGWGIRYGASGGGGGGRVRNCRVRGGEK